MFKKPGWEGFRFQAWGSWDDSANPARPQTQPDSIRGCGEGLDSGGLIENPAAGDNRR